VTLAGAVDTGHADDGSPRRSYSSMRGERGVNDGLNIHCVPKSIAAQLPLNAFFRWSANRIDSMMIVNVGFDMQAVGNTEDPAT